MKKSVAIVLAIATLALFAGCSRKNNNYYLGGPFVSVVTGTLTTKTIDKKDIWSEDRIYFLNTTYPINLISVYADASSNEKTLNNIRMFQLINNSIDFYEYEDMRVRLTGTFYLGDSANYFTKVLLYVEKVEVLAPRTAENGRSIRIENYEQAQQTFNENDYSYTYPTRPDKVTTYYFDPSISVVTGIMTTRIMDTNDNIGTGLMKVDVITTDYPINVIEINDDALFAEEKKVYNARVFHVINNDIDFSVYRDRHVRLTGYFYLWDRYYHYSKAVFFADKVEVLQ